MTWFFTLSLNQVDAFFFLFVDHIIISKDDAVAMAKLEDYLHQHFRNKNLGDLKYFVGIEVTLIGEISTTLTCLRRLTC